MENFNKIISFILGLVVVIVFLIIISGRWNVRQLFRVSKGNTASQLVTPTTKPTTVDATGTPTTTKAPTRTPTPSRRPMQAVNNIPNTGANIVVLPLLLAGLAGGLSLRKKS